MKNVMSLLTVCLVLGLCGSATAVIHRVPSEYPTIQAGIDAAVDGDTVLVADGVYMGSGNRDIDFHGKAIIVMSEHGAPFTWLATEGWWSPYARGFYFHSGEDSNSVAQGFTIERGSMGIECDGSSPTIRDCTILLSPGPGIRCFHSSAVIEGNVIKESGRGIYCRYASPTIRGNTISLNNAPEGGGGIYCYYSSPVIKGNRVLWNYAHNWGGGIYCEYDSYPLIAENIIMGNTASYGGGINCRYHITPAYATIRDNVIMWNESYEGGGGIACSGFYRGAIIGNTIVENAGGFKGGGIRCFEAAPTMERNTIALNSSEEGGGIFCDFSSSPTLINSIVWENGASVGREIYVTGYYPGHESSIEVSYSAVEGGSSAVYVYPSCTLYWGEGNIEDNPAFTLLYGRDCRLLWESPCIDAGHPDSLDPDGTRRDMGANFFDQDDYLTVYLTPDQLSVSPGDELGVTYTVINRWAQPEPFWVYTDAVLPNGNSFGILGPAPYVVPAEYTAQVHISHSVPAVAPPGEYEYRTKIGVPPSTLYDEDSFPLLVVQEQGESRIRIRR